VARGAHGAGPRIARRRGRRLPRVGAGAGGGRLAPARGARGPRRERAAGRAHPLPGARDAGAPLGAGGLRLRHAGAGLGPLSLFGSDAQRARYLPGWRAASGSRRSPSRSRRPGATSRPCAPRRGATAAASCWTGARRGSPTPASRTSTWSSPLPGGGGEGVRRLRGGGGRPRLPRHRAHRRDRAAPAGHAGDGRLPRRADALVGEAGGGMRVALGTLDVFRSTVGAAALGFARRALDEAVGWAASATSSASRSPSSSSRRRGWARWRWRWTPRAARLPRRLDARHRRRAHHPRGGDGQAVRHRGRAARDRRRGAAPGRPRRRLRRARWRRCTARSARCASTRAPARSRSW
jgi:hypothetical protein